MPTRLVLLIYAILSGQLALAQGLTGQISGTVLDPADNMVAGARVSLSNALTGQTRQVITSSDGSFLFSEVLPGSFSLSILKTGFHELRRTDIHLSTGERLSLESIHLEIGAVTETVTVSGVSAPLQTESSERAGLVDSQQLKELSLKGRDFMGTLQLLPGTLDTNTSREAPGSSTLQGLYFNGNRQGSLGFTIDGIFAMDTGGGTGPYLEPSIDAIAEVKVLLTNFQAEYGRTAGGTINTIIKSGSRDFHGGAYYFFRNEALNADEFFNNRQGLPRPVYRYNYPGYFLGGPVLFPGTSFNKGHDKLFFFWSQEFLSRTYPTPLTFQTFPTALERQGNFSQSLAQNGQPITIRDSLTNAPFPGNIVPASRIDPNGQGLLNVFPQPNAVDPTRTYNYAFQSEIEQPRQDQILRVDWNISGKDQFFARGMHDYEAKKGGFGFTLASPSWAQLPVDIEFHSMGFVSTWIHTFTPTSINVATFGVNRGTQTIQPPTAAALAANSTAALGLNIPQWFPQSNPLQLIPNATFAGVPDAPQLNIDQRYPYFGPDNIWDYTDNFSISHGTHRFKFGAFVEKSSTNKQLASAFNGQIAFDRDANNPLDSGYAFSNALLGIVDNYSDSNLHPVGHGRDLNVEWYAQDSWRAARNLTVDAGVRFYFLRPTVAANSQLARFDTALYSASAQPPLIQPYINPANGARVGRDPVSGQIFPAAYIGAFSALQGTPFQGMSVTNEDLMRTPPIQVAPRLGIAWDVSGRGTTAIRAGAGIFYDRFPDNQVLQFVQSPPLVVTPTAYYTTLSNLANSPQIASPNNVFGFQTAWKPPAIYNWSFGVQQELPLHTVLSVAYVGDVNRHQLQIRDLNATNYGTNFLPSSADPTSPGKPLPPNFLRPYIGYGSIQYMEFASNSNYNALQAELTRRFSTGLTFSASYTWSKVLDVADTPTSTVNPVLDYNSRNYGPAIFDRRQKLTVNFVYALPGVGQRWNSRVARGVLNGWEISSILAFSTGAPTPISYTFVTATDVTGASGIGIDSRVDLSCDPTQNTGGLAFNVTCVHAPTRAELGIGGASKYPFSGPGVANADVSLFRNILFPHSETRRLQLRIETYNTVNHTQFTAVNSAASFAATGAQANQSLGLPTAAAPARRIALGVKFYF
ncbi:MAG TPA: carboxypeptidase-like regulatory domain-containing protein [Bryobacteraceae bacterium]|nr:carboxypeptidase-like regulatory domain-containing protein [Bryobacteraceae bacterium]